MLTRLDVHRRRHPGLNLDPALRPLRVLLLQRRVVHVHLHAVVDDVALWPTLRQCVRADVAHFAFQRPVNAVVVRIKLDRRGQAHTQGPYICRLELGFDYKLAGGRHQLQQDVARANLRTRGGGLNALYECIRRRIDLCTLKHRLTVIKLLLLGCEVFLGLGHLHLRILEELALSTRNLALQLSGLALQPNDVSLAYVTSRE
ncbi:hypothetical protein D9M68_733580 [compost metagenome]